MLINPTIDFLTQRAHAIAAILGDQEPALTARQLVALLHEYDNLAAAMRAVKHPLLHPAAATYPSHEDTLWAWYCADAKLHESHDARTLCAPAQSGRLPGVSAVVVQRGVTQ